MFSATRHISCTFWGSFKEEKIGWIILAQYLAQQLGE